MNSTLRQTDVCEFCNEILWWHQTKTLQRSRMERRFVMKKLTYNISHSAGFDAGNRSMNEGCRSVWNLDDYNAAAREFARLWPDEKDMILVVAG